MTAGFHLLFQNPKDFRPQNLIIIKFQKKRGEIVFQSSFDELFKIKLGCSKAVILLPNQDFNTKLDSYFCKQNKELCKVEGRRYYKGM